MKESDFLLVLEKVKRNLENRPDWLKTTSEIDFEKEVAELMRKELESLDESSSFSYSLGSSQFPDIAVPPFGVEVKFREKDAWDTTGNSIMEGSRKKGVETIYVIFLKQGGTPAIKILKYEDCLSDIVVTHSPRYTINMNIANGQTIFSKIGVPYEEFRKSMNKISLLRKHYKESKKGSTAWWLTEGEETQTTMELKAFSSLSLKDKKQITSELYTLFPQVLNGDYSDAAAYLLQKYESYNSSLRDLFSSGGRVNITIEGEHCNIPASLNRLLKSKNNIKKCLSSLDRELFKTFWDKTDIDSLNEKQLLEVWLDKVCSINGETKNFTHIIHTVFR
jgi:hypothetical protein